VDEALELSSANLKFVWDGAFAAEKAVLAGQPATAGGPGAVSLTSLNETWAANNLTVPTTEASRAVQHLFVRQVILAGDTYKVAVDLQRLWILKYQRLEWVVQDLGSVVVARHAQTHFVLPTGTLTDARPTQVGTNPRRLFPRDPGAYCQFPLGLDGNGQCIRIIELGGGYRKADLEAYSESQGLPVPEVVNVEVDGGRNHPSDPDGVDLMVTGNIKACASIAPRPNRCVFCAQYGLRVPEGHQDRTGR
jgi:hypothetical protein